MMGGYDHGYAPQAYSIENPWSKALESGAVPSPETGMLVCQAKYDAETDPRSGPIGNDPDLSLQIDVGGGGELRSWGANNTRNTWFSVPQPELTPGATLRVHFHDRNWGKQADEKLGTLTATWNGVVPLSASDPPRSMTCAFLANVAAFVGGAHPQVRALVTERDAVSSAKQAAAQQLVAEKRAALDPGVPCRGPSFEVSATGVDGTKRSGASFRSASGSVDEPTCTIVLDVVALDRKLSIGNPNGIDGARCVVLLDDGSAVDNQNLSWEVRKGNRSGDDPFWEGQAEKGEHLIVAVATKPGLRPTGPRPALFLLLSKKDVLVVRIP